MIFMTTYKIKPYLVKEIRKSFMATFAEHGPGPGVTAHYVAADGSQGVAIAETDDVAGAYLTKTCRTTLSGSNTTPR